MGSNMFGKVLTSNIKVFIPEEYPNPPTPTFLEPNRGGPEGGGPT